MQYNKYQPSKQVVKLYFTILLRINLINIKNMGSLIKSIKLRKKKNKTKKKKGKTKRLKKKKAKRKPFIIIICNWARKFSNACKQTLKI